VETSLYKTKKRALKNENTDEEHVKYDNELSMFAHNVSQQHCFGQKKKEVPRRDRALGSDQRFVYECLNELHAKCDIRDQLKPWILPRKKTIRLNIVSTKKTNFLLFTFLNQSQYV
jgi:hypothetical protein